MPSPESGVHAVATRPSLATSAQAKEATTSLDLTSKHQPDVHVTPLSVSHSQAPSAAATNPPSPNSAARSNGQSSRHASINSQNLAWDQAFLRIEYLVSTMTTPSPYSPILSPLDNASYINHNIQGPISPLAVEGLNQGTPNFSPPATPTDFYKDEGGRVVRTLPEDEADVPPATRGWPLVPREKVRRKVLQIDTWRAEVASHGLAAFCACSSPAPMRPASSTGAGTGSDKARRRPSDATAPVSPVDAMSSSPGGHGDDTSPPTIAIPPPVIICGFCGRPPSPFVALKSPTVAAGVKKAFVDGFKGLLRRRSWSRKDRDKTKVSEASPADKEKGKAKGVVDSYFPPRSAQGSRQVSATGDAETDVVAFTRTEMYHIDMPSSTQPQPSPESPSPHNRQSPTKTDGDDVGQQDSNDSDEEDVDLDNMTQSTNPRGLLQSNDRTLQESNDRLKRAEKLHAKSHGTKASIAADGTKSLPVGDGVGGGGGSGFGLGWGEHNGGDRSRKGFGKLR